MTGTATRPDRRSERATRLGYCAIGIYNPKREVNVGTLYRTAASLGAAFTFQIGGRYREQCSDTCKAARMIPHFTVADLDEFHATIPWSCVPVAVELDDRAVPLDTYAHPDRAVYLLGAEDGGLPPAALAVCRDVVQLPGRFCLNVSVAGSVVLYDRHAKRGAA